MAEKAKDHLTRPLATWQATLALLVTILGIVLPLSDRLMAQAYQVHDHTITIQALETRMAKLEEKYDKMQGTLVNIDKQTAVWAKSTEVIESWVRRGTVPKE